MNSQKNSGDRRRRLSTSQMVCLATLWAFLVYIVLVSTKHINALLLITIFVSGLYVGLPIYRELKRRGAERNN